MRNHHLMGHVAICRREYSSPRVLTLEYMPGIKITDVVRLQAAGIDTKLVAQRSTESYLLQVSALKGHSSVHDRCAQALLGERF